MGHGRSLNNTEGITSRKRMLKSAHDIFAEEPITRLSRAIGRGRSFQSRVVIRARKPLADGEDVVDNDRVDAFPDLQLARPSALPHFMRFVMW